jgi:hypothetical protein
LKEGYLFYRTFSTTGCISICREALKTEDFEFSQILEAIVTRNVGHALSFYFASYPV